MSKRKKNERRRSNSRGKRRKERRRGIRRISSGWRRRKERRRRRRRESKRRRSRRRGRRGIRRRRRRRKRRSRRESKKEEKEKEVVEKKRWSKIKQTCSRWNSRSRCSTTGNRYSCSRGWRGGCSCCCSRSLRGILLRRGRRVQLGENGSWINVAAVKTALKRKHVLAVVLAKGKAGTVQGRGGGGAGGPTDY